MKCPNCNVSLVMADRSGIEIDYCPDCRGVWLDRGELDKIIERSSQEIRNASQVHNADPRRHASEKHYPHKKKKDLWDDLFDF